MVVFVERTIAKRDTRASGKSATSSWRTQVFKPEGREGGRKSAGRHWETQTANERAQESTFCNLTCFLNDLHTGQWPQGTREFGENQRVSDSSQFTAQESSIESASGAGLRLRPYLSAQSGVTVYSLPLTGQELSGNHLAQLLPARICKPAAWPSSCIGKTRRNSTEPCSRHTLQEIVPSAPGV